MKVRLEQQQAILSRDGSGDGSHAAHEGAWSEVKQRLIFIPMAFILLRMWGTIQFFYSLTRRHKVMDGCVSEGDKILFVTFGVLQVSGVLTTRNISPFWSRFLYFIL